MISINTNTGSLLAKNILYRNNFKLDDLTAQLASGKRINSARDDSSGLAISMKMEGQARGFAMAQRTIGDGQSYLNVADKTLQDMGSTLSRMRELSVQAQSETLTDTDLAKMNEEFSELAKELTDVQSRAKFNGKEVIGNNVNIVVDADGNTISVGGGNAITDLSSNAVDSAANAKAALDSISGAIGEFATSLSKVGAYQSRLEKAMSSAMAMEEAQWTAQGRIMDADIARVTADYAKFQILQQSGVSMLAQANQSPQFALSLLGR